MHISSMLGATMIAGAPAPGPCEPGRPLAPGPENRPSAGRRGRSSFPAADQTICRTLRIPSWASISSKPLFTSASGIRCEMNGSTSISPAR